MAIHKMHEVIQNLPKFFADGLDISLLIIKYKRAQKYFINSIHNLNRLYFGESSDRKCLWVLIDKENVFLNMESRRHKRRTGKPKREPAAPKLEERSFVWFERQREEKLIVNYKRMRVEAKKQLDLDVIADSVSSDSDIPSDDEIL